MCPNAHTCVEGRCVEMKEVEDNSTISFGAPKGQAYTVNPYEQNSTTEEKKGKRADHSRGAGRKWWDKRRHSPANGNSTDEAMIGGGDHDNWERKRGHSKPKHQGNGTMIGGGDHDNWWKRHQRNATENNGAMLL